MLIRQVRNIALMTALLGPLSAPAQQIPASPAVSLIDSKQQNGGWDFSNGQEFPGAKGSIALDNAAKHEGRASLKLSGDFSGGGNYVATTVKIPSIDARELSLWARNPDSDRLTLRLNDASGQTHQLVLKTEQSAGWQHLVFPIEQFFARQGQADAVTSVAKYEYWGGANDGKWHGPATALAVLVGPNGNNKVRSLWLSDVSLTAKPSLAALPKVASVVRLDEFDGGQAEGWKVEAGDGANASISVQKDDLAPGRSSLKYLGAMPEGGAGLTYLTRDLRDLELSDITSVRMRVKSDNVGEISVRLVDGTGQTHQFKGVAIVPDSQWHDLVIESKSMEGIEHWAGANDGQWHGQPLEFTIIYSSQSDKKDRAPALFLADVRADAVQSAVAQPAAFKSDFEASATLPQGWNATQEATIATAGAFKGRNALALSRAAGATNNERPIIATGPTFPVTPGQWQFGLAARPELKSPDDSYSGVVAVELLEGGKVAQSVSLAELYGTHDWQPISKIVDIPRGVSGARFVVRLNKPSGRFLVDELSAAYLAPAPRKDRRVARLLFSTPQLGHLWLPGDPRKFEVRVESTKPLLDAQRTIAYEVRDYWGAEQTKLATVSVEPRGKNGERFLYTGSIDLSAANLEVGRYYEIHGSVPREGDEPFRNYSSFAILPEAVTRQYKPSEVPFTSRDWDNRIGEYLRLADRIGIRVGGLWGGWSEKAPYEAEAPGLDIIEKAGMGWITGTPAGSIERGETKYDEAALRGGVRNLIQKFGRARPMYISLGNEPHGSGAQVLANVNAYRVLYDEIKKIDPTIFVVATSVEPNEEYFKAGYGKYCDAYDFHIYEDSANVRAAIAQYQALMKKYDVARPIWSTELGLNSQGMPRNVVAGELWKKFAVFFAAGGANVSWFDFLYPDGEGTNGASSGAAHDVFDSRFNLYAPKLSAIAYYNAVNAIAIKKFVAEKEYPGGIHAFLFRDRDGKSLQVLWKDKGRADIALPLPGVQSADLVRLDGSHHALSANGQSLTTSVSDEPILVLYDGGSNTLPQVLGAPMASIEAAPTALRGASALVKVALNGAASGDVNLVAPAFWTVKKLAPTGKSVQFEVTAPEDSDVREADYTVTLGAGANRRGELYVRTPVSGKLALQIAPVAAKGKEAAGVRLTVSNNGSQPAEVSWDASLDQERALLQGTFGAPVAAGAQFGGASSGSATVAGKSASQFVLPLSNFDPLKIYRVRASVSDSTGRAIASERLLGGMAQVLAAKSAPKLDGSLDEAAWKDAPAQLINQASQMQAISAAAAPWKGAGDLSARLRFLWDERNLYIGAQVTDDVAGKLQTDDALWAGDGLQLLIDPSREAADKPGKYDISLGVGANGPRAWFHSSADAGVPTGLASDVKVSAKREEKTGSVTYEIAIPWSRLAPFKPRAGADLGLSLALNEDDGKGRFGFMSWFGDVQSKSLDDVGDLILGQ